MNGKKTKERKEDEQGEKKEEMLKIIKNGWKEGKAKKNRVQEQRNKPERRQVKE